MADFQYGVLKQNGNAKVGETLGLSLDFWTVTTPVNILAAGWATSTAVTGYTGEIEDVEAASQAALDKLIEIISLNGQPVILNAPTGTGPYTLTFAIEHTGSWTPATLTAAVLAHGVNYGLTLASATVSTTFAG